MTLEQRAQKIQTVLLDVDGVLTDGRVGYSENTHEIKFFDVKDGLSIKLLHRGGIKVGVLSGRESRANDIRIKELGIDFVYQGEKNKLEAFHRIETHEGVSADSTLYIGDDLVDLPVLNRVAVSVAVGDAVEEIKEEVDMVTNAFGGRGAIREVAVWLLKTQGKWAELIERYKS